MPGQNLKKVMTAFSPFLPISPNTIIILSQPEINNHRSWHKVIISTGVFFLCLWNWKFDKSVHRIYPEAVQPSSNLKILFIWDVFSTWSSHHLLFPRDFQTWLLYTFLFFWQFCIFSNNLHILTACIISCHTANFKRLEIVSPLQ